MISLDLSALNSTCDLSRGDWVFEVEKVLVTDITTLS